MVRITFSLTFLCAAFYGAFAQDSAPSPTSTAPPAQITAGNCFYPGSNPPGAYGDRPCDPDAEVSMCCPLGWTCLSNKICQVTDGSLALAAVGTIQRGTCTDPRWNDTVCGDFCLNPRDSDRDGQLLPCGNNVFVCAGDANLQIANCEAGLNVFTLAEGAPETIISVASGTSTLASTTSSPTGSSTLGTSVRPSSSAAGASTTPEPTGEGNPNRTRDLAIGITIGVVALIAIILTLLWFFRWRKPKPAVAPYKGDSSPDSNNIDDVPLPPSTFVDTRPPMAHTYGAAPPGPPSGNADGLTDFTRFNDNEDEITDTGHVTPAAATAATAAAAATTPARVRPERNIGALDSADREHASLRVPALVGSSSNTSAPRDGVTLTDPSRSDFFGPSRPTPPGR